MGLIDDAYRLDLLRGIFAYGGRLVVGWKVDRYERACIHYCAEHSFVGGGCDLLAGSDGTGKKMGANRIPFE